MSQLQDSLVELIRRTSAEIPDDVHKAILTSLENEKKNSLAANAIKIIDQNIALAKQKSQPICQDTGSILFFVDVPIGYDQITFAETAREAVTLATTEPPSAALCHHPAGDTAPSVQGSPLSRTQLRESEPAQLETRLRLR